MRRRKRNQEYTRVADEKKRRILTAGRLYLISLLISMVVLLALYIPYVYPLIRSFQTPQEQEARLSFDDPHPPDQSGALLLIVSLSKDTGDVFILTGVSRMNAAIPTVSLPAYTACDSFSNYPTLGEAFEKGGPGVAAEEVGRLLGIATPQFLSLDTTSLIKVVDQIGPFTYRFENDITYTDEKTGFSVDLRDEHEMTGVDVASLLLYNRIEGGGLESHYLESAVIAALINQKLTTDLEYTMAGIVEAVMTNGRTNLPLSVFKSPVIGYFALQKPLAAHSLPVDGTTHADGSVLTLSNTCCENLGGAFR